MSRQKQRRAQNAGSLIRPAMVVKLCDECGAYGLGVYDMELNRVGIKCPKHARAAGFCPRCGNAITKEERERYATFGGCCIRCIPNTVYTYGFDEDDQDWDEWKGEDDL